MHQVASEFLVTGTFLMMTLSSWGLDTSGATAHFNLLPAPPASIEPGCDACVCDLDGVVAGVDTGAGAGSLADREVYSNLAGSATSPISLCPVPRECGDAAVQNATQAMKAAFDEGQGAGWEQPAGFRWRACTTTDLVSDECDPTVDVTRDNALAFLTVFAVQCAAIALGHVVMMWKLRRMVAGNKRSRRRAMADPRLLQRARRFVADAKAREEQQRGQRGGGNGGNTRSARARFRRAVIVTKFGVRARKAAAEASTVESVDDVVLEISEAVAAHWKESLPYFVAAGTAAMAITFMQSGLVVSSQTT
jgi:hypothetical protein